MAMAIRRGIIASFDPTTYTASVLIIEATSATLTGVPIANHIDGTSAVVSAYCAVLFFDEANPNDCVIIAAYGNGANGFPTPAPGRLTIVAGFHQLTGQVITNGNTFTLAVTGSGNIPAGAHAVLLKVLLASSSVPSHLDMAAHGGDLGQTISVGDTSVIADHWLGQVLCPLDTSGKLDVKANGTAGQTCTVDLWSIGYVI